MSGIKDEADDDAADEGVCLNATLCFVQAERCLSCGTSAPSRRSSTRPSWKDRTQVCSLVCDGFIDDQQVAD